MKPPDSTPPLSSATLYILLALASQDLHGYGIIQDVARQSGGSYRLGPGTLYDNLKKLMDRGLVVDAPTAAVPEDETRRLYHLTSDGRALLSAEIARLESITRDARTRLGSPRPRRA